MTFAPKNQDEVCASITTEAELEQYRIGLQQRGAYTTEAARAIEARRLRFKSDRKSFGKKRVG